MTPEQMEAMLTRIMGAMNQPKTDASTLGPMRPCEWGTDRMKRVKFFKDWKKEAEVRMKYLGEADEKRKLCLIQTWGGPELIEYMTRVAKVNFEDIPAVGDAGGITADTYTEAMEKVTKELAKHVNRTMAVYDLFNIKQDSLSWMEYVHLVEDKALICQFDERPYTFKEAVKDALVMGVRDNRFRQKALMDDPDLDTLVKAGMSHEEAKDTADILTGSSPSQTISRVAEGTEITDAEIDTLRDALTVMKMKKAGKYSNRHEKNKAGGSGTWQEQCNACLRKHTPSRRCPAVGRTCFDCNGEGHFSKSPLCSKQGNINKMTEEQYTDSESETDDYSSTVLKAVGRIRPWPGVRKGARSSSLKKVKGHSEADNKWVTLQIGKIDGLKLFTDTGSYYTIIPPDMYQYSMGKVVKADTRLRAWGTKGNLDVKGMINTQLTTAKGATTKSKVYIVAGFHPEPLLGDRDAEALGFIKFNPAGREPTEEEKVKTVKHIPQKLRKELKVEVHTTGPVPEKVPISEKQRVNSIVSDYKSSVFRENIGCIVQEQIHLDYVEGFKPIQPEYRSIPIRYQSKVSECLEFLREEDVIEDVDPKESYDCVMNVVITDKKAPGEIRMNIDNTPWNEGMKRTKYHVQTPQEIRHELRNAKVFSEMDMGYGYHQMELDEESSRKAIFQTHEGVHRMKRLYFGPTAATGIFHSGVRQALKGVPGTSSIHDNIIVYGVDYDDHANNLKACLKRCEERNITLKLSKSSFCMTEIEWFGRVFTAHGVTADPKKIKAIIEAGRPENIEDVRSLLQACQYNAKFIFDSDETSESYEEVTQPLRELLRKDAKFAWTADREEAYVKLMKIMSSPATLRPFDKLLPAIHVADASAVGICGSIYQIQENGVWVPVDHASRTLQDNEKNYDPIDRESLAQSWSMEQFRYYLLGSHFVSYTHHEPLLPTYNNPTRKATARIDKHKFKVQDLEFTMAYLRGKDNPCDYGSRHPLPMDHLNQESQERAGYDQADEIYIRRVISSDLPDAVTLDIVKEAATKDPVYMKLYRAIRKGCKTGDRDLIPYTSVWRELSTLDGLVIRGERLVIPDSNIVHQNTNTNIRKWVIDIAHEGCDGETSMKRLLRARLWFPGMDRLVSRRVQECHTCQCTTHEKRRDPLIPTTPPESAWTHVDADHWGPTPDGRHVLVVIDRLSRFPVVKIVKGTAADANIEAFDDMFSTHGFPIEMKTDGGPPFNGSDSHSLRKSIVV